MAMTSGEILKKKREEKHLTLEQVASGTNIRVQYLKAIEEDRVGAIASKAQYRGFIRLYASYLGINPLDFLDQPVEVQPELISKAVEPEAPKKTSRLVEKIKEEPLPEDKPTAVSDLIFKEIGTVLQKQRQALGLSLNDVERQIKIKEQYLYALENGLINELPSSVQGRGMLNNYASFMSLTPEPLQMRFAEGLQQRRIELTVEEIAKKNSNEIRKFDAPITGWRRFLTPDLVIGSGVIAILLILIVWGVWQVIGSARHQVEPTTASISSVLVETNTPTTTSTGPAETEALNMVGTLANTASVDLLATITQVSSQPIQVVIVAYQRAFLKVSADGKEVFVGRTVPGNAYTYTGTEKVSITTGNAAAIQVYYNQQDLGILGQNGQVANIEFLPDAFVTPTPQFTASPTATKPPTLTPLPTNTVLPTATPSITPLKP